jgi:hypothetical protein
LLFETGGAPGFLDEEFKKAYQSALLTGCPLVGSRLGS